ncbi:MAG: hypothetical protein R3B84_20160 [Zavarzinella sp.]
MNGPFRAEDPELLRLEELKTFRELAQNATARLYVDFNNPTRLQKDSAAESDIVD